MSIKIMSMVWESGPEKLDLLVLLALADFADDQGYCWPSIKRIAEKSSLTERGTQKIIRRLEEGGYLKIDTGGGRRGCNQYQITLNHVHPLNEVHPEPECKKPRTRVQETLNGGSPEPSLTIKEPSISSEEQFDEFWDLVPKKVSKGQARTAFKAALKKTSFKVLCDGMSKYAQSVEGKESKYIKHPSTWLNGECWEDETASMQEDPDVLRWNAIAERYRRLG